MPELRRVFFLTQVHGSPRFSRIVALLFTFLMPIAHLGRTVFPVPSMF